MILAQLEQSTLYNAYNFSQASSNSGVLCSKIAGTPLSNTTVISTLVATFACPSDEAPEVVTDAKWQDTNNAYSRKDARRSNYLLPSSQYQDTHGAGAYASPPQDRAMFFIDYSARISDVTDGLSNTTMIGESPQIHFFNKSGPYWGCGSNSSTQGRVFPPYGGNASLQPHWMPNGPTRPTSGANPKKLLESWAFGSKHPGGLNMAFGDGSVRFVKNSINPYIWFGIQTIKGAEIIGSCPNSVARLVG